jgi:hypothetical protein
MKSLHLRSQSTTTISPISINHLKRLTDISFSKFILDDKSRNADLEANLAPAGKAMSSTLSSGVTNCIAKSSCTWPSFKESILFIAAVCENSFDGLISTRKPEQSQAV